MRIAEWGQIALVELTGVEDKHIATIQPATVTGSVAICVGTFILEERLLTQTKFIISGIVKQCPEENDF